MFHTVDPPYLSNLTLPVNSQPLLAATAAEKQKVEKYDVMCQSNSLTIISFLMEISDAMGKEVSHYC